MICKISKLLAGCNYLMLQKTGLSRSGDTSVLSLLDKVLYVYFLISVLSAFRNVHSYGNGIRWPIYRSRWLTWCNRSFQPRGITFNELLLTNRHDDILKPVVNYWEGVIVSLDVCNPWETIPTWLLLRLLCKNQYLPMYDKIIEWLSY